MCELLKSDINLNVGDMSNRSPLWWTIDNGDSQLTKMLLEKGGIDVNIQDFVTGEAPWHKSIWFEEGETDIVEKLLDAGADPRITDLYDLRAFDLAVRNY